MRIDIETAGRCDPRLATRRASGLRRRLPVLVAMLGLSACAGFSPGGGQGDDASNPAATRVAASESGAGRPGAVGWSSPAAYIRFRAEDIGLRSVVDDGRATYLSFDSPPPQALALFDQDGRPLPRITVGQITAVDGLHAGLLVRLGEQAGFVAPEPREAGRERSASAPDDAHRQLRSLLGQDQELMLAMQRALAGARGRTAVPGTGGAGGASGAALLAPAAIALASAEPVLAPPAGAPAALAVTAPLTPLAPLAMANASAVRAEQGLVRVFFAQGSRSIVAPEDGLALLLRNAGSADEIQVTGYTDAVGGLAANQALARARAEAVVQILIRRGIEPGRIVSHGVAAAGFIADNDSDRGRALNRRVEVVLIRQGRPLPLR